MGVLGVTLWTSIDEIARRVQTYREAVKDAKPLGKNVNNQVALFTFVHCAETEEQAMKNGAAEAAAWYTNAAFTFFQAREDLEKQAPEAADGAGGDFVGAGGAGTSPEEMSDVERVVARLGAGESISNEEIYGVLAKQDALIVGDPDQCREKMKAYEAIGIDRLMCFQQVGHLTHDSIMDSMRLIGRLIPEFAGRTAVAV